MTKRNTHPITKRNLPVRAMYTLFKKQPPILIIVSILNYILEVRAREQSFFDCLEAASIFLLSYTILIRWRNIKRFIVRKEKKQ